MGREVRMVPPNWNHPQENGRPKPLLEGPFSERAKEFLDMANKKGLQEAVDYFGQAPSKEDYMPEFEAGTATHLMMYETTSEGTPISPAFETPELLARWLTDNGASAFGGMKGSYEGWLSTCKGGYAPSMVLIGGRLMPGTEV